jgi:hypothetical protein
MIEILAPIVVSVCCVIMIAGCCLMLTFPIAGIFDWFDGIKAKRQRMEKKKEYDRYIRR